MARLAVYWLPEAAHPLWAAGCAWLGRDPSAAETGSAPPGRTGPWRYGFHATLKAPLHPAAGLTRTAFVDAVAALAASAAPFELPPLAVGELDGFVALRPSEPCASMQALAERCVRELDPWRAPMPQAEFERRAAGLDGGQRALLARWGYPHVLDRWRLHLTLTDRLPATAERQSWRRRAEAAFAAALALPLPVSSIAVLEEPAADAPFRLLARVPLGGRG